MEAGCLSTPLGPSVSLCLPAVCASQAGSLPSSSCDRPLFSSSGSAVATEGVVHGPSVSSCRRTSRTCTGVEPSCPTTREEVPPRPRDPPSSHVEVIQHLIRKAGFSRKVVCVAASDLRRSTAALYQSKWTRFFGWCDGRSVNPCKATLSQIAS